MGRKNRNRQDDQRSAAPREERGADIDTPAEGGGSADQVSEALSPGLGEAGHKTQKHKEKRFGHN